MFFVWILKTNEVIAVCNAQKSNREAKSVQISNIYVPKLHLLWNTIHHFGINPSDTA